MSANVASQLEWKKIVAAAYFFVIERRTLLSHILAVPFVALLVINVLAALVNHPLASLILYPAVLAAQTLLAIPVHRFVLLGDQSSATSYSLSKREIGFAAHIVVVTTVASLMFGLAVIPAIGPLAALLGFTWVGSRFALVFPGIAIDRKITLGAAWRLSRNHQGPLMACVATFPIVIGVPTILLVFLVALLLGSPPSVDNPVVRVVFSTIGCVAITIVMIFTMASLSIAFREVIRVEGGNTQTV